jgi:hypothetical protein
MKKGKTKVIHPEGFKKVPEDIVGEDVFYYVEENGGLVKVSFFSPNCDALETSNPTNYPKLINFAQHVAGKVVPNAYVTGEDGPYPCDPESGEEIVEINTLKEYEKLSSHKGWRLDIQFAGNPFSMAAPLV